MERGIVGEGGGERESLIKRYENGYHRMARSCVIILQSLLSSLVIQLAPP